MSKQKINNILKKIRESKGLSQRALAREMNVTNSYISLIESENRIPSMEFLSLFARKFNVPLLVVFEGALSVPKTKEEAQIQKQLKDIFNHYDKYLHANLKTKAAKN